jgi:hypothetical protein
MFSSDYETSITSQELVSALFAIATRQSAEEYLSLELVSPNNKPTKQVSVRLTESVELANRGEILHCITREGKKIDFIIPHPPKDRADGFLTAHALIEDGA